MIEVFHANRATFEALRTRICAKAAPGQTVMMDPKWSRPAITPEVATDYYGLLDRIGAKGIQGGPIAPSGACHVWIEYWSFGWAGDGDYKKYSFGPPIDPAQVVTSLDGLSLPNEISFYRRELVDGWALEYHHWP